MTEYIINGRKILKERGMLFKDWCKINGFEYLIDELDLQYLWDNYGKTLDTLTQGFDKPVRWVCTRNPNHVMRFKPVHRTNGHWECSYCSGHFLSLDEHSAYIDLKNICDKEWNYEKNDVLPTEITSACRDKVWWTCSVCGLDYESTPYHRKEGKGCPYCANLKIKVGHNDLFSVRPDLEYEWNYDLNDIDPHKVPRGCDLKVWWICKRGHEWQATITGRANENNNCLYCGNSSSFPERVFVYYFKQVFTDVSWRNRSLGYEYDIALFDENVLLEYNGVYWHSGDKRKARDNEKFENAISLGYYYIMIFEVLDITDECMEEYENYCIVKSVLNKTRTKSYSKGSKMVLNVINLILRKCNCDIQLGDCFVDIKRDLQEIFDV